MGMKSNEWYPEFILSWYKYKDSPARHSFLFLRYEDLIKVSNFWVFACIYYVTPEQFCRIGRNYFYKLGRMWNVVGFNTRKCHPENVSRSNSGVV